METTEQEQHSRPRDRAAQKVELERRGHLAMSWNDIVPAVLPNGVTTAMYRVGLPDSSSAPTVFKVYFPPDCYIEAHTHHCDYSEIILEGSQKVGSQWHYPGDIRVGLANRGYGPLIAGPEGVTVLFVFADGRWPAVTIGKNDGSTLNVAAIAQHFESR